jgi:single-stranded DNA-specific DHH superfamily exonuclease
MFNLDGSILLIHHWDTDGISSAALLLEHIGLEDIDTWTPPLGTFYLTNSHILMAQNYDNVVICDVALPKKNVERIAQKSNVILIDHHHQDPIKSITHINPVANGASGNDYPSNTWVIKELLELPVSLLIVLGFIGDREEKIKENARFWKITKKFLEKEGMEFNELLSLVYRIDSNYKVGDRNSVIDAPHKLKIYNSKKEILSNENWLKNHSKLDEKIKQVLDEPPELVEDIQIKRLHTPYAIISQITRRLAWGTGMDTIVLNTGFFEENDQLYGRSNNVDMHNLISKAKEHGFNAGGKTDVIGAIIPKNRTEEFLKETIEYIKRNREN